MMMPYFTETGLFKVEPLWNVPKELQRPEIRMTLDYEDDLKFFKAIFGNFKSTVPLREVLPFLDENPELIKINQYLQQRFLDNQRSKTKLVIK
jgi:spore coat polysaccharide biosynthesis protein SpsF